MRLKLAAAAAAAAATTSPLQDVCERSNKMSWVMLINQLIFWSIRFSFTPTNQSNKFKITCTFKLHYATQCPHVSFKWCRLTEIQRNLVHSVLNYFSFHLAAVSDPQNPTWYLVLDADANIILIILQFCRKKGDKERVPHHESWALEESLWQPGAWRSFGPVAALEL